jgi:hypothetical protein
MLFSRLEVANYKQLYERERAEVQILIQQNQNLQDEKVLHTK